MNELDLRNILYTVQLGNLKNPIAIRYPRGQGVTEYWEQPFEEIYLGKGKLIKKGDSVALLTIGTIGNLIQSVIDELSEEQQKEIAHYDLQFIKPLDSKLLISIFGKFDKIITLEDHSIKGGFGSSIVEFAQENNFYNTKIKTLGIPDNFIEHGSITQLNESVFLDKTAIKNIILKTI
jgi:1-deoxy-D-xylulose-5-phosphate synthase